MKLSLSRWRKDTISREGSSFFQSDPLPLSLSRRRGKNYLVILRKAKNLFSQQFLKIDPLPLSLSHRRGKNYLVILRKAKNLLSQQLKKNQPSPSIPLRWEREELPRHTKLIFYPTETLYIITSVNITKNFSLEYSQNIRLLKIRNFIYFTCRRWIYVINIYSWNSIE